MKYHAPTNQFTVSPQDLEFAASAAKYAIQQIRKTAGLPTTPYKHEGAMGSAQFAEKSVLDFAEAIGIDMGAKWHGQLDVSDAS